MATLYVTEYADLASTRNAQTVQMAQSPPVAEQVVTYAASVQSAAFNPQTRFVRVQPDGIASLAFGVNPTAVTNTNMRMTAGSTEYFGVPQGQAFKVAAVTST